MGALGTSQMARMLIDGHAIGINPSLSVNYVNLNAYRIINCGIGIQARESVSGAAFNSLQFAQGVDISNCTTGIALDGPNSWHPATAGFVLSGTGNTTAILLAKGARMSMPSGATITGTTEVSLDGVSTNLATMRAATPKLLTNTYGTIIYE
jgi:hypothetical protein